MQETALRRWVLGCLWPALATLALAGCSVGHLPKLDDGYYQVAQTNDSTLMRAVAAAPLLHRAASS